MDNLSLATNIFKSWHRITWPYNRISEPPGEYRSGEVLRLWKSSPRKVEWWSVNAPSQRPSVSGAPWGGASRTPYTPSSRAFSVVGGSGCSTLECAPCNVEGDSQSAADWETAVVESRAFW